MGRARVRDGGPAVRGAQRATRGLAAQDGPGHGRAGRPRLGR